MFGSYNTNPSAPNFVSHYKNLFHHYVHQTSHEHASTFWSGCGAVKREQFVRAGGFDPDFTRPTVEDIEFGMRLHRSGHRIVLNKDIQVTHAKRWSLGGMIKSNFFDRALRWTQLILREKTLPNDLNLTWSQRFSAALAYALCAVLAVATLRRPVLALIPVLFLVLVLGIDFWSARSRIPTAARCVGVVVMVSALGAAAFLLHSLAFVSVLLAGGIVLLNARFYGFFMRERNTLFAIAVFPLHLLYFAYSGLAFALGTAAYVLTQLSSRGASR